MSPRTIDTVAVRAGWIIKSGRAWARQMRLAAALQRRAKEGHPK